MIRKHAKLLPQSLLLVSAFPSSQSLSVNMQVALKCADIGHLAATPDVHKRWALLLEEEFFLQV